MNTKKTALAVITLLSAFLVSAQIPTEVPKPQDNQPVDFSDPIELVIFIVLPLVVVVLFIIWTRKKRKDATASDEQK
ncbi:MAG TPA: hypothetical protein VKX40_09290 [Aequorivita sp.]|nr:hypothetical protein [Aequorivita sp.]